MRHIAHRRVRSGIRVLPAKSLQKHSVHRQYRSVLRTLVILHTLICQAHMPRPYLLTEIPAGPHWDIPGPVASTRPVGFSTCQRDHVCCRTEFPSQNLFNLLESFVCIRLSRERTLPRWVRKILEFRYQSETCGSRPCASWQASTLFYSNFKC